MTMRDRDLIQALWSAADTLDRLAPYVDEYDGLADAYDTLRDGFDSLLALLPVDPRDGWVRLEYAPLRIHAGDGRTYDSWHEYLDGMLARM